MNYGSRTHEGIFEVPCTHPSAEDGLFRAQPAFLTYHRDSNSDRYGATYFMADVDKLIALVQKTDPSMIEHARYRYRGETAENWLENNKEYPYDTGSFVYYSTVSRTENSDSFAKKVWKKMTSLAPRKKLALSTGNAGMLILLREAGVSEIPVGVQTDNRYDTNEILDKIGVSNTPIFLAQKEYPNWGSNERGFKHS